MCDDDGPQRRGDVEKFWYHEGLTAFHEAHEAAICCTMGQTSDGITASDWERVHELALAIVNTDEPSEEDRHRSDLLNYLDELIAKYGELPSLLATRVDYVQDPVESERLLLRAFEAATRISDTMNLREIALSLADLYTTERPRRVNEAGVRSSSSNEVSFIVRCADWLSRPPSERIAAVEFLRQQFDGAHARIQRVYRFIDRARPS